MTVRQLVPIAIVVVVLSVVTWLLLTDDWAIGPWLLAGLLFAHGCFHLAFVFPQPDPGASAGMPWPFDMTKSWLVRRLGLGVGLVRPVGIAVMAGVAVGLALAALATIGFLVPVSWWAGLVAASAIGSLLLLTMFFSPTFVIGYAIDLALLWLVLASGWSPVQTSSAA